MGWDGFAGLDEERENACPGVGIVIVAGRPAGAYLHRHLVKWQRKDERGGELAARRLPDLVPSPRHEVVAERAERGDALITLENVSDAKDHRGSVVHARMEQRAGEDQPVDVSDCHGDWRTACSRPQQTCTGRAMQEKSIAVASECDRQQRRLIAEAESNVRDQSRVENLVEGGAIAYLAIAKPMHAGPVGDGHEVGGHGCYRARIVV
jgi:hypothetical protein